MSSISSDVNIIDWDTILLQIERRGAYLSAAFVYLVVFLFMTFYSGLVIEKGLFICFFVLILTPFLSYIYGKVVRIDASKAFKNSYFLGIDVFLKNFILSLITNSWLLAFFIAYYINTENFIVFTSLVIVFASIYALIGSIKYPLFKSVVKAKNAILKNNKLIIEYIIERLNNLKPACFINDIMVFLEDFVIDRKNTMHIPLLILKVMSEVRKRELACSLISKHISIEKQCNLKKKIDKEYLDTISILTELSEKANIDQLVQLLKNELKNILIDVCTGVLTDTQLLSEKIDGIYNDLAQLAPLNKVSSFVKSYTLSYYLRKTQIKDIFHAFSIFRRMKHLSPERRRRFACRTAEFLFKHTTDN